MSLNVLVRILDPGHGENNDQWKDDQSGRNGREFREELENGDEGEKSERRW